MILARLEAQIQGEIEIASLQEQHAVQRVPRRSAGGDGTHPHVEIGPLGLIILVCLAAA